MDYYAFNEPGADVEVRGMSEIIKRAKPVKWAHTWIYFIGLPLRCVENFGSPMTLQRMCAVSGAHTVPVRMNKKSAYHPNTDV